MSLFDREDSAGKLIFGVILLIILLVALSFVTFSLAYSIVSVDSNIFRTGNVSINLNDGETVIDAEDANFAPGMTIEREFFLQNNSSYSVYYRLYFANLRGDMADVLVVTISDGDKVLYNGVMSDLEKADVRAADDELKINERRTLTITIVFPEEAGNLSDNVLRFDLCADATQTKNNPDRIFD